MSEISETTPQPFDAARVQMAIERERAIIAETMRRCTERPRDLQACIGAARAGFGRWDVAERAFYSYKLGGTMVTGPTVYTARRIAQYAGGIRYGFSVLEERPGSVLLQASAIDCYTLVSAERQQPVAMMVPRKQGPEGQTVLVPAVGRDAVQLVLSSGAKLERNALLAVLPEELLHAITDMVKSPPQSSQFANEVRQKKTAVLDALAALGVSVELASSLAGVPADAWGPSEIMAMRALVEGLRSGELSVSELLGGSPREPGPGLTPREALSARLAAKRGAAAPKAEPAAAPASAAPVPTPAPEPAPEAAAEHPPEAEPEPQPAEPAAASQSEAPPEVSAVAAGPRPVETPPVSIALSEQASAALAKILSERPDRPTVVARIAAAMSRNPEARQVVADYRARNRLPALSQALHVTGLALLLALIETGEVEAETLGQYLDPHLAAT